LKITELLGLGRRPLRLPLLASPGAAPLPDPEITGLTADSRQVEPGFLFAALQGRADRRPPLCRRGGAKGAVAILTDDPAALASTQRRHGVGSSIARRPQPAAPAGAAGRVALLSAATRDDRRGHRHQRKRPRWRISPASSGRRSGTNRRASARSAWSAAERRAGALTTPDPGRAAPRPERARGRGVEHAAIEASSHGLAQFRLDGVEAAAAAFTNLTRDHLDYHGDMESYRAAKDRLFTALLAPGGSAVLNADSPEFPRLAALVRRGGTRSSPTAKAPRPICGLVSREPRRDGQRVGLEPFWPARTVELQADRRFPGDERAGGARPRDSRPAAISAPPRRCRASRTVPGRMQLVGETPSGAPVFVDYAHTPDALATVLAAARPHAEGRLIVVFGAGGDRDRGKRPLMGQVCAERGRSRLPSPTTTRAARIRRRFAARSSPRRRRDRDRRPAHGDPRRDRRAAPGDVLVIAGKGHETGQIVGRETLPFDDAAWPRGDYRDARAASMRPPHRRVVAPHCDPAMRTPGPPAASAPPAILKQNRSHALSAAVSAHRRIPRVQPVPLHHFSIAPAARS
jgi:UDP-N-acetylmuramoyl-L-alanyl-D-glutamate--2,6-diaminopimelate ligase